MSASLDHHLAELLLLKSNVERRAQALVRRDDCGADSSELDCCCMMLCVGDCFGCVLFEVATLDCDDYRLDLSMSSCTNMIISS